MKLAIRQRRWWMGGGYDVHTEEWPTKIAWFHDRYHAEQFCKIYGLIDAPQQAASSFKTTTGSAGTSDPDSALLT
jgi:hypothetical protein